MDHTVVSTVNHCLAQVIIGMDFGCPGVSSGVMGGGDLFGIIKQI